MNCLGSMATISIKYDLSTVIICEKFTTDDFCKHEWAFSSRILGGDFASCKLEVITAHITVFILLALKSSPWMTSTGLFLAGSEPRAEGRRAHHISPLITTNLLHPVDHTELAEYLRLI